MASWRWLGLLGALALGCGSDDSAAPGSGAGGLGGDAATSGGSAGAGAAAGSGANAGSSGAGGVSSGGSAGQGTGGSAGAKSGIWSSAAELSSKPMSGAAWTELLKFADGDTSTPNVSDQDDPTNVRVLAAAIAFARGGDVKYKAKVEAACVKVQGSEKGGRTLAWGRETGAYAMAADLVGYSDPAFNAWLKNVADVEKGSELNLTLRQMFEKRPNNWGSMAFGSLTAIYRFLGEDAQLKQIRDYWAQGVTGKNPGYQYDADVSWHVAPNDLRLINPKDSLKQGVNIDGIIPDDMRRGGPFTTGTPAGTGYPWEHLQGVLMAARVLQRAGLEIWSVDDQALRRAASALQDRIQGSFLCAGDDLWQLAFFDDAYGTTWSGSQNVWRAGKNAGFAYVLP
ncbi:MAG: hypothetical protein R3B13_22890 [Polyangiaceae bacterium]